MIPCRFLGVCAGVAGVLVLTAFAFQDKGKEATPAAAPMPSADEMEKWMAFATPGAEHKMLESLAGSWTTNVKMWMDPAAPVSESTGTTEGTWVMGNRFVQESHKGTFMGMPFEGMGLTGYDNLKKKYVGSWVDNCGTGIMTSEGTYDAAKKTITYATMCPDATMTKYVPAKMVLTFVDANSHKLEMWGPDKSGKEYRCMEITYTRAK